MAESERNRIALARAHIAFLDSNWPQVEELLSAIRPESIEYQSAKLGRGRWKYEIARRSKKEDASRQERIEQALQEFREVMLNSKTPADVRRSAPISKAKRCDYWGEISKPSARSADCVRAFPIPLKLWRLV